ncbi:MAG: cobalt ECF transporter T component CbiQ [Candidatus Omnitrophica bacterium CG1_02_40_15]|nr:MAG: cobalt ECF transporter T component CbiQ [Candidatus Omnitrophica bacterium CG1_02_40_15]
MKHSFIDEYSDLDSLIHRLDPRVKLVTLVASLLFIISTRPTSFVTFVLYGILIFILIGLSKIPIGFIFKRSLVIIPFVLIIAIFIPFFKKGQVAGSYSFGSVHLTVTYEGLMVFWNVLVKAYLSILCMILLATSTKFSNLLKAFENMKCPKLMTMILSFMHRYIYVLVDEMMRMKRAKDSRTVGGKRWFHVKALSHMVGVLFIRAYERGERVYLAMCSRGFSGQIRTLQDFKLNKTDFCFLLTMAMLLIAIRTIRR